MSTCEYEGVRRLTCSGTRWPVSYVVGTTPGRYHAADGGGDERTSNRADTADVRQSVIGFRIVVEKGELTTEAIV